MKKFGSFIRDKREELRSTDKAFSLRKVAIKVGVEPAYLSKIERNIFPPPSEEVIRKLANLLDLDADVLLAMAGKVSSDLQEIIQKRPALFAEVIRQMKDAPDNAILNVVREIRDGEW